MVDRVGKTFPPKQTMMLPFVSAVHESINGIFCLFHSEFCGTGYEVHCPLIPETLGTEVDLLNSFYCITMWANCSLRATCSPDFFADILV